MPSRRVKAIETRIGMPGSIVGVYAGDAAEFSKSLAGQPWLILAAIVTIYIVLGVLYESYIHPITILSTLPSAGVGAILALMLFGQDLSVIGLIGIILLMGIVKKNAIMMIDFALEAERHQGMSRERRDRAGLPAALPPDHDDDAGRAVRRAAAGDRKRHRRRIALSARHLDHRRPAAEPVADALHHAGDLSRARPAQPPDREGGAAGRAARRRRSRAPPRGCSNGIDLRALHPPAGRHHAAGDRALSGRRRRLRVPAGVVGSQCRFSDRSGCRRRVRAPTPR